ncbi:MAG: hypothetical protein IPM69_15045 [Ignavibacteria bacterium]|nr:hypothetical protein [Ignavibacteria bacterium]
MGIAAHDLKNPLSAIMLKADIMRRYWKQLSHTELLSNIDGVYSSAQRMKDIITNLLDTHAIESGAVKISLSEFPLSDFVLQKQKPTVSVQNRKITSYSSNRTLQYYHGCRCPNIKRSIRQFAIQRGQVFPSWKKCLYCRQQIRLDL